MNSTPKKESNTSSRKKKISGWISASPLFKHSHAMNLVLSGKWRMSVAAVIITVLMTIALWSWSDEFISEWWHDPIYRSDFIETDCIQLSQNVSDAIMYEYSEKIPPKEIFRLYNTDMIKMLREERVVENIYGFDITHGIIDNTLDQAPILLGTPETFRMMNYDLLAGDASFSNSTGIPDVIVSGGNFAGYNVGDTITIASEPEISRNFAGRNILPSKSPSSIKVRIAGKLSYPYITQTYDFYLKSSPPYICGDMQDKIFMLHTDENIRLLEDNGFYVLSDEGAFYVSYRKDAQQSEIDTFRNEIAGAFSMNTYYYIPKENIVPTTSLMEREFVYYAEKKFDIKPETPLIFRIFIPFVPLVMTIISSIVLVIAFSLTFNRVTSGFGNDNLSTIMFSDAVKASVFMSVVSFIVPFIILAFKFDLYMTRSAGGLDPYLRMSEIITSHVFIYSVIAALCMMAVICTTSILYLLSRLKKARKSAELTKESFTYRPAEYYTDDSYVPNDFEMADYSNMPDSNIPQDGGITQGDNADSYTNQEISQ